MNLDPAAIEYLHLPVTGAPFDAADLELAFGDGPWVTATWNDEKNVASLLIGGPNSGTGPQHKLPPGNHRIRARLADTPEVVIRNTLYYVNVR